MVVGSEQADLASDRLGVGVRASCWAEKGHLVFDPGHGVGAVDPYVVGVAEVVAGVQVKSQWGKTPWVPSQPTAMRPSVWPGVRTWPGRSAQHRSRAWRVSGSRGRLSRSRSARKQPTLAPIPVSGPAVTGPPPSLRRQALSG